MAVVTLAALVLVPFLFWHGTWFGRPLDNRQLEQYLDDNAHPRHIQHALVQISERLQRGDRGVERWYPRVCELAANPQTELRVTAAWLMGQDNHAGAFHEALLRLLADPEPLVRRNAALSLARFGDASGRPVLRSMLEPYTLVAPRDGKVDYGLKVGETATQGTVVARITTAGRAEVEVQAQVPGKLAARLAAEGASVKTGDPVASLAPSSDHAWEALRALYLVGTADDLPAVEKFTAPAFDWPAKISQQARITARQIRDRSRLSS